MSDFMTTSIKTSDILGFLVEAYEKTANNDEPIIQICINIAHRVEMNLGVHWVRSLWMG